MTAEANKQARRLYGVFSDMLRRYQFRDREQICCHGLSVSQCYALEALGLRDSMTMGELAAHLCLKISSMTRVVDFLVESGLVRRVDEPGDRRVCRIRISVKGRTLVGKVQRGLVDEYEQVLRNVPSASREAVIQAITELLSAYEKRSCGENRDGCC
jgi:DNA-binding MarR family transcriptional regulator